MPRRTGHRALLASGVGTDGACRKLGIARTTGYYWRTQRGGAGSGQSWVAVDHRHGRESSLVSNGTWLVAVHMDL